MSEAIKAAKFWDRRAFLQSLGAAVAATVVGCGKDEETAKAEGATNGAEGQTAAQGAVPAKAMESLASFKKSHKLRFPMVELVHFADRSRDGMIAIPLATMGARKYITGGWRSGWDATPRKDGDTQYIEADSKTSRVFFKHTKGGFDRLQVRMKAVRTSNAATFYVNDEAIETVQIDGTWKDYTVTIPEKFTHDGENQLMLRFKHDTTESGRKQAAHVASVFVLPKGADPAGAPKGEPVEKVKLDGDLEVPSLVARSPQTYTYWLDVPVGGAKLSFLYGAQQPGVTFKVSASSDKVKQAQVLLEETIGAEGKATWRDAALELKAFEGDVVEIALTVSGEFPEGQVAAWGDPGLYMEPWKDSATPAKGGGKAAKNVVVYLIDTQRYDKFDFYNPKTRVKTPHISAFAKDATIFDAAYDNENWTKPSTASILTGLYPDTHGAKEDTSKLPQDALMISEHLKKQGFKTGAFLANGYVSDAFGFKQGWDFYTNYIREEKNTDADNVVKDAIEWIDKNKDGRFFAYLHTIDPHVPYSPPKQYKEMYWNREYNGPIKPQATGEQLAAIKTKKLTIDETDKRYLEALYDGETSFNDSGFGMLVAALKEKGLYDDTVIVIIADHGEEFWDHESVGHGHSLYEELIHSILVVRYPEKVAAGRRVPHVVSMVDLAPTLCDIAGVEGHADFEGRSWAPVLDGVGDPYPRMAVSDFLFRKKAVRAGRYKWITIGRHGQLFDVVDDPSERKDLIKSHGVARAFLRTYFGFFAGSKDKSRWWESKETRERARALKADQAEMDADTRKMLEELGYVDGAKGEVNAAEDKKKLQQEENE